MLSVVVVVVDRCGPVGPFGPNYLIHHQKRAQVEGGGVCVSCSEVGSVEAAGGPKSETPSESRPSRVREETEKPDL